MEDKIIFYCEDIKKHLKPFMEDLLAEDEYQAYVRHLNTCARCKDYIDKFGSISNQLWELGNIKVPADFSSAVCFNISEPAEEPKAPKESGNRNLSARIIILAVILAGIAAGIIYIKKAGFLHKNNGSPVTVSQNNKGKNISPYNRPEELPYEPQPAVTPVNVPKIKNKSKQVYSADNGFSDKGNKTAPIKIDIY